MFIDLYHTNGKKITRIALWDNQIPRVGDCIQDIDDDEQPTTLYRVKEIIFNTMFKSTTVCRKQLNPYLCILVEKTLSPLSIRKF